jgi:formate hydrogenlyase subunit 4
VNLPWTLAHLITLLASPVLVVGVINRTKARWAGRRGPPLAQTFHDLVRLARKLPVYSETTTAVFWVAPYVMLATAAVSGLIVPMLGVGSPLAFRFDFVFFAYLWGLGRMALMLGALDTGSAFEGMGASREATFSALVEPALFLSLGTLATMTGATSFSQMLAFHGADPAMVVVRVGCTIALTVLLQVESARMPVDDPTTHLELTMVHEVMILDHSGPDLAAMEYGAAMKLAVGSALLASLLNPFGASSPRLLVALSQLALMFAVAVAIGTTESTIARLRLSAVPRYLLVALFGAVLALLASVWRTGGAV